MSCFKKDDHKTQTCICSKYAATALAIRVGPDYTANLAKWLDPGNPSLNGWLMEIYIFKSLLNSVMKAKMAMIIFRHATMLRGKGGGGGGGGGGAILKNMCSNLDFA